MPLTRSKKTAPKKKSNRTTKKKTSESNQIDQPGSEASDEQIQDEDDQDGISGQKDSALPGATQSQAKKSTIFQSRFPALQLDTFEHQLDSWTVIKLQESIVEQNSRRSKAPKEIKDLIKIVRMEFEKRILMIALMAGVPEVVIWNLVGMGSKTVKANPWIRFLSFCVKCLGDKLPERDDKEAWVNRNQEMATHWHALSKDQQDVFKDPYFFALANLPDYSNAPLGNDKDQDGDENDNGVNVTQFDTVVPTPKVHKLSDEDRLKYQPLFDELVNVEKLHLCHGKPESSHSVATLQKRSSLAVRKAHHDFAVVCQQHQISYYLTAASCGDVDGWSQTFSNSPKFADWAKKTPKIPAKFKTYVHGLEVAQEIEKKEPQPSDKRKSQLCHLLNDMMDSHVKGQPFPKVEDPVKYIEKRGWPIQIVQKSGSQLQPQDLARGHRRITDAVIRVWLKDIENNLFTIESKTNDNSQIDSTERDKTQQQTGSTQVRSKQKKKKTTDQQQTRDATRKRQKLGAGPSSHQQVQNQNSREGSTTTLEEESDYQNKGDDSDDLNKNGDSDDSNDSDD